MHPAASAFIKEIKIAVGDNTMLIERIAKGDRFSSDGVDITADLLADARNRLSTAKAILVAYA